MSLGLTLKNISLGKLYTRAQKSDSFIFADIIGRVAEIKTERLNMNMTINILPLVRDSTLASWRFKSNLSAQCLELKCF